MVSDALHHGPDAAVADTEAFSGHAADVGFTVGRAVEGDVADDDIFFGFKRAGFRRSDSQSGTGQTFAEIVVGIAAQVNRESGGSKRTKTLASRAAGPDDDGVGRQTLQAVATRDFVAEHRCHRALHVADRQFEFHRFAAFQRRLAVLDQFMVQHHFQAVVLALRRTGAGNRRGHLRFIQDF